MQEPGVFQLLMDLRAVIKRHSYESDVTYAEIVGVLESVKFDFIHEARMETEAAMAADDNEEEEDEEDDEEEAPE